MKELIWFSIPGSMLVSALWLVGCWKVDSEKTNSDAILTVAIVPVIGFLVHQTFRWLFERWLGGFHSEGRKVLHQIEKLPVDKPNPTENSPKARKCMDYYPKCLDCFEKCLPDCCRHRMKDCLYRIKTAPDLEHRRDEFLIWEATFYDDKFSEAFRNHDRDAWHYILSFRSVAFAALVSCVIAFCHHERLAGLIYVLVCVVMWWKARLTIRSLYDQEEQMFKQQIDLFQKNKAAFKNVAYTPQRDDYIPKEQRASEEDLEIERSKAKGGSTDQQEKIKPQKPSGRGKNKRS